jgi:orotate phosphoribosyltransferase
MAEPTGGAALELAGSEIESLLAASGALCEGHFLLSSGLHSPRYVQCALLLEEPRRAAWVGRALGERLRPLAVDSVLAPAMGGLIVGHEVASALGVPFRFTERREGRMELRRGFRLRPGERVAVVEDVVTTGRSTRETMEVAAAAGAAVVAVAAIIDRAGGNPFAVPFHALLPLSFPTWPAGECPLCAAGGSPEKPGSRG